MKTKVITEFAGLDLELYLMTEILKMESLHYGYWQDNTNMTLQGVRHAQDQFTEMLLRAIPESVQTVLDVGCGIGDVSRALVGSGYNVTAVSPDKHHARYFQDTNGAITFISSKFEKLNLDKRFDLILMSESQNYFPTRIGFLQCAALLEPNGYLLVAGMFRKSREAKIKVTNVLKDYIKSAREFGLQLVDELDITQEVLPTIEFINNSIENYVEPGIDMLRHFMTSTSSLKTRLFKLFLQKQINRSTQIYDYYKKKTNPEFFKENLVYTRLLFQFDAV
jgi:2-polyprenyl-3-methyl-5-hydroxy-6-metoxy-1,4-benzoquinol methylase